MTYHLILRRFKPDYRTFVAKLGQGFFATCPCLDATDNEDSPRLCSNVCLSFKDTKACNVCPFALLKTGNGLSSNGSIANVGLSCRGEPMIWKVL